MRARLVQEKELSIDTAITMSGSFPQVEETGQLKSADKAFLAVSQARDVQRSARKCFQCGNTNHAEDKCRFRFEDSKTHRTKGPIAKMCRSKGQPGKFRPTRKGTVQVITRVLPTSDRDDRFLECQIEGRRVEL